MCPACWAAPMKGRYRPQAVAEVTGRLLDLGCYEVSLGDTIGVGSAGSMQRLLGVLLARFRPEQLAVHCHDTYGQALSNILVALQHGIAHGRRLRGRTGRLSLCARRLGQCRHRGCGLHAAWHGHRNRPGAGQVDCSRQPDFCYAGQGQRIARRAGAPRQPINRVSHGKPARLHYCATPPPR